MRVSVLDLLRNKVLHEHREIGTQLEFPDNLWVEAACPTKGHRVLASDSNSKSTI